MSTISPVEEVKSSNFDYNITDFKDVMQEIEKTDDDGVVQIYSYKHCSMTSSDKLKECRGLVYQGENRLFKSLGFTPEYSETDREFLDQMDLSDVTFYPSEEGTLIRVFYVNGKWYVSTHRKLDAFKSRWGSSISFGDIFMKALIVHFPTITTIGDFTCTLDQSHIYFFLIRNTDGNRMVARPPSEETVYHVGTLMDGTSYDTTLDVGVPKQVPFSFTDMSDVIEHVKSVDPFQYQGVIGFYKDGKQFKIVNTKHQLYMNVRGNEASIPYRYLQIRSNPTYVMLMNELYPEKTSQFGSYENAIFKIAKFIHFSYMERFINKKHVVVPKEEYRIIKECHGWHITDREHHKVTLNVVMSILSHSRFASTLNILIKRY